MSSKGNELIKEVMRDYGYIEHMGMGIPRKVMRLMLERGGDQPHLIERDSDFLVSLRNLNPSEVLT